MAGGVALYAMNLYFTASLLPSVVAELGGRQFYAWASTAYLIAAVTATMFTGRVLGARGSGGSYVIAYLVFAAGTALAACSPAMQLLVAGRAVQGLGAGLLTGLGFATIRAVLPSELWTRATGLVSAMFGVGTLFGPALGGLFAQFGAWRAAFAALAGVAILLVFVTARALPRERPEQPARTPIPFPSIVALAVTAALLSLSSTLSGAWIPLTIAGALALLLLFFALDARNPNGVLPRLAYVRGNPLKWVYLTVAGLCAGITAENFIPLFGQQLAGASPIVAGILGAAPSVGWTTAQVLSVSAGERMARARVRTGPVVVVAGFAAYGLLQRADAGWADLAIWAVLLFLAGAGVGMAYPHLSVAAMRASDDPAEGAKAAAAVSTTQLVAFTLTSAIAGNLLAFGGDSPLASAQWLILGVTALTALGIPAALLAMRGRREAGRERV
ncbi:MFS transporter [Leucobacter massiliensis]|uniref:MFS transporter n=2 Tax=Leucobacter massiliensis TaxID=1686285 RepID=A0A2S9QKG2_9MICO|nr:MFS transporter [Leucobacter massiliensis]PRI10076.1 MFS transporter [Leucobacter massiliensis]